MNEVVKQLLLDLGLQQSVHYSKVAFDVRDISDVPDFKRRWVKSPVDASSLGAVDDSSPEDVQAAIRDAASAFSVWRLVPPPERGDLLRQLAAELKEKKSLVGSLVSWECGKSLQEGLGEVQEMIDICYFAQGLSRSIHGVTLPSERRHHRIMEQYHPLGVVGLISAFNFPVAVWSWNLALALVCGNTLVWKPSEKTPLCALACQCILDRLIYNNGYAPGLSLLVTGGAAQGKLLAQDKRIALLSATGSVKMGVSVAGIVAARLGKTLLELGGNNAVIISPKADISGVLPGIVFGAVGTAGQRCTSTRRLIVHESVISEVRNTLKTLYARLRIGNPLDESNQVGPLIDYNAVGQYLETIRDAFSEGAKIIVEGGIVRLSHNSSDCYVKPCVLEIDARAKIVNKETFAPILFLMSYSSLEEAVAIQNGVPQGLSSSIMTTDLGEAEYFLGVEGSDCGIANVNTGTSGAEIGGAFGGEKETGGGRESGSDAWKAYMRRQTSTIHSGSSFSLAQGIRFDV